MSLLLSLNPKNQSVCNESRGWESCHAPGARGSSKFHASSSPKGRTHKSACISSPYSLAVSWQETCLEEGSDPLLIEQGKLWQCCRHTSERISWERTGTMRGDRKSVLASLSPPSLLWMLGELVSCSEKHQGIRTYLSLAIQNTIKLLFPWTNRIVKSETEKPVILKQQMLKSSVKVSFLQQK